MANFATLSSLLAGCTTRVKPDACASLFAATTPPAGKAPTDTLGALQSVARNSAYRPERLFGLLDAFYPIPQGKNLRRPPYMPYLNYAPTAWTLPLKFAGGGQSAPGKIMFDAEGNAWTGVNFIVGSQALDDLWDGNLSNPGPRGYPYWSGYVDAPVGEPIPPAAGLPSASGTVKPGAFVTRASAANKRHRRLPMSDHPRMQQFCRYLRWPAGREGRERFQQDDCLPA